MDDGEYALLRKRAKHATLVAEAYVCGVLIVALIVCACLVCVWSYHVHMNKTAVTEKGAAANQTDSPSSSVRHDGFVAACLHGVGRGIAIQLGLLGVSYAVYYAWCSISAARSTAARLKRTLQTETARRTIVIVTAVLQRVQTERQLRALAAELHRRVPLLPANEQSATASCA